MRIKATLLKRGSAFQAECACGFQPQIRIAVVTAFLFGLLALCPAQLKYTLQFDSSTPREVFVASSLPKEPPATSVKSGGATLDYSLPAFGGDDRIYVWDHATNNIASKPIKEIANNTWAVKPTDYTIVGTFTVHVEHKGQAVQAANVSVASKGKSEQKLLAPNEKGDVQFFGYPMGELRVKVSYVTADKKDSSQEQIFPVDAKRDKPEPVLNVAIPEDVATVADTTTAAPTGQTAPKQQPNQPQGQPQGDQGSTGGKLVLMLIALLVIVGGAYWAFYMFKNKPQQVQDTLTKLGVQIPQQQDPNAAAPTPVQPLAPAPPPPKIMLDDAEPVPLAAATAVAPPVAVSSGEPTLIRDTGERVTLPEGDTIVGREEGLGLSLAGESTVSRRHATVTRAGGTVVVNDSGSTNGTFVNGIRLQGETTLKPGDQVQFGSVRFRFEG